MTRAAAPYTPATVQQIRTLVGQRSFGGVAAELGWSPDMLARICQRHGIDLALPAMPVVETRADPLPARAAAAPIFRENQKRCFTVWLSVSGARIFVEETERRNITRAALLAQTFDAIKRGQRWREFSATGRLRVAARPVQIAAALPGGILKDITRHARLVGHTKAYFGAMVIEYVIVKNLWGELLGRVPADRKAGVA